MEAWRIAFRQVSHEWHVFCMFDSVLQEEGGKQAKPSRLADVTQQAAAKEDRRWKKMWQVDIAAELRWMLGPETQFCRVQEGVLQAIMQQESLIMVVMGTGSSKS
ncbi:hypothetical protein EV182_008698, partial [Spiromyces aspiralis]